MLEQQTQEVNQIRIVEHTIVEGNVVSLMFENVPLVILIDNELLLRFTAQFTGGMDEMFKSQRANVWCPTSIAASGLVSASNVVVVPTKDGHRRVNLANRDLWKMSCETAIMNMIMLMNNGLQPNEVIGLLPLCLQFNLTLTGTMDDFLEFFGSERVSENDIVWSDCSDSILEYLSKVKETLEKPAPTEEAKPE